MRQRFEIYASTDLDSVAESLLNSYTKEQLVKWFIDMAEMLDDPCKFIHLIKREIKKWEEPCNEQGNKNKN